MGGIGKGGHGSFEDCKEWAGGAEEMGVHEEWDKGSGSGAKERIKNYWS